MSLKDYDWFFHPEKTKELKITRVKRNNKCKLCEMFKTFIYDNINAMRVCTNCGYCYRYQSEDIDYVTYFHTHRIVNNKNYYKRDKRLKKCLLKCEEMTNKEKSKVIKMFEDNLNQIKNAYRDNGMKNLNYNYIIRKLLELTYLTEYMKYYPLTKSKKSLMKSKKIWNIVANKIRV